MDKRRKFAPAVVLVCLLAQPIAVRSQCVAGPPGMGMPGGMTVSATYVVTHSVAAMCTGGAHMNVIGCFPATGIMATGTSLLLGCSAFTPVVPGMEPYGVWMCTCGGVSSTFTLGPSEGLPVELMDFEISDGGVSGDAGEDGEARGRAVEEARAAASR